MEGIEDAPALSFRNAGAIVFNDESPVLRIVLR